MPHCAYKARCWTRRVESRTLSQIVGAQVFLKFENLQFTASFKGAGPATSSRCSRPKSERMAWSP